MAQPPHAVLTPTTAQPPATTAPPAAAEPQGDAASWWLSTEKMTLCLDVDARGFVVAAPPIARKFIGQPSQWRGDDGDN